MGPPSSCFWSALVHGARRRSIPSVSVSTHSGWVSTSSPPMSNRTAASPSVTSCSPRRSCLSAGRSAAPPYDGRPRCLLLPGTAGGAGLERGYVGAAVVWVERGGGGGGGGFALGGAWGGPED